MRPARPKCSDLPSDSVTDHAPDFVERSDPFEAEAQSILAQRGHALLDGRLVQLFRRAFDGRADVPLHGQDLVDGDAASVAGPRALETAAAEDRVDDVDRRRLAVSFTEDVLQRDRSGELVAVVADLD